MKLIPRSAVLENKMRVIDNIDSLSKIGGIEAGYSILRGIGRVIAPIVMGHEERIDNESILPLARRLTFPIRFIYPRHVQAAWRISWASLANEMSTPQGRQKYAFVTLDSLPSLSPQSQQDLHWSNEGFEQEIETA